jgi:hypothetical protein
LLANSYRRKKLKLYGKLLPLRKPGAFDQLYGNLKKKKWVVHPKRPFGGPEQVLKYLARYTHRIAIANGRLVSLAEGHVTFRWRDSANGNAQKIMAIDAVEFIRRFLMHVLPPGFVKIRHFGFLANTNRRTSLALCRSLLSAPEPPADQMLTEVQWRALQRKCPVCHIGTLRVIRIIPPGVPLRCPVLTTMNTS